MGREAKVQLVDEESGGWGHLLFDHLILSDYPAKLGVENANWVDYGPDFYAAVTWNGAPTGQGGPPWIAWMSNWKYAGVTPTSPWRSAMSLPRTLSLRKEDGRYVMVHRPVKQIERWRGDVVKLSNQPVSEANATLGSVKGKHFDLLVRIDAGDAAEAGIKVRLGDGEETLVGWSRASGNVFVDRIKSGNTGFHPEFAARHGAPIKLKNGLLEMRVILDDCSVEVFADGGAISMTNLIFPSPASDGLEFYHVGGTARVVSAEIFPLRK
jgi:levanase